MDDENISLGASSSFEDDDLGNTISSDPHDKEMHHVILGANPPDLICSRGCSHVLNADADMRCLSHGCIANLPSEDIILISESKVRSSEVDFTAHVNLDTDNPLLKYSCRRDCCVGKSSLDAGEAWGSMSDGSMHDNAMRKGIISSISDDIDALIGLADGGSESRDASLVALRSVEAKTCLTPKTYENADKHCSVRSASGTGISDDVMVERFRSSEIFALDQALIAPSILDASGKCEGSVNSRSPSSRSAMLGSIECTSEAVTSQSADLPSQMPNLTPQVPHRMLSYADSLPGSSGVFRKRQFSGEISDSDNSVVEIPAPKKPSPLTISLLTDSDDSDAELFKSNRGKGKGKSALNAERRIKATLRKKRAEASVSGDSRSAREREDIATDQTCSICLTKFENRSFLNDCFHSFCHICILQWSELSRLCPLCKTQYDSLIHSVGPDLEYEQYFFPAEGPDVNKTPEGVSRPVRAGGDSWVFSETMEDGRRFRYRSTITNQSTWLARQEQRRQQRMRAEDRSQRMMQRRLKWSATKDKRSNVYKMNLWVKEVKQRGKPKVRQINPAFFKENPALTHRLVPWLLRDLNVLLGNDDENIRFVLHFILTAISKVGMDSREFQEQIQPFLFDKTEHFVAELVSFARSPYDIKGYDDNVVYEKMTQRSEANGPGSSSAEPAGDSVRDLLLREVFMAEDEFEPGETITRALHDSPLCPTDSETSSELNELALTTEEVGKDRHVVARSSDVNDEIYPAEKVGCAKDRHVVARSSDVNDEIYPAEKIGSAKDRHVFARSSDVNDDINPAEKVGTANDRHVARSSDVYDEISPVDVDLVGRSSEDEIVITRTIRSAGRSQVRHVEQEEPSSCGQVFKSAEEQDDFYGMLCPPSRAQQVVMMGRSGAQRVREEQGRGVEKTPQWSQRVSRFRSLSSRDGSSSDDGFFSGKLRSRICYPIVSVGDSVDGRNSRTARDPTSGEVKFPRRDDSPVRHRKRRPKVCETEHSRGRSSHRFRREGCDRSSTSHSCDSMKPDRGSSRSHRARKRSGSRHLNRSNSRSDSDVRRASRRLSLRHRASSERTRGHAVSHRSDSLREQDARHSSSAEEAVGISSTRRQSTADGQRDQLQTKCRHSLSALVAAAIITQGISVGAEKRSAHKRKSKKSRKKKSRRHRKKDRRTASSSSSSSSSVSLPSSSASLDDLPDADHASISGRRHGSDVVSSPEPEHRKRGRHTKVASAADAEPLGNASAPKSKLQVAYELLLIEKAIARRKEKERLERGVLATGDAPELRPLQSAEVDSTEPSSKPGRDEKSYRELIAQLQTVDKKLNVCRSSLLQKSAARKSRHSGSKDKRK